MTTLITGATGFVGAAVARRLLAAGHDLRALARPGSDRRNLRGLELKVIEGDLGDRDSLNRAIEGCDVLFHVAADYRLWARDTESLRTGNLVGTRNMMGAAQEAGVGRIVYTSSVAVLGIPEDGGPGTEDTPVTYAHMIGAYKQSKFLAEREVRRMIAEEGLPAVIVNPSTPVGPRDIKPTPTGRLIVEAASGRVPAFVDTGLNLVNVDDVAEGHLLALEKGVVGERYVLGGEDWTLREILAEIARICGRKPPTIALPHGLVMPIAHLAEAWAKVTGSHKEPFATVDGIRMARKKMFFSSDKARARLGYAPRPAVEGLRDAIDWFRANRYVG
ncbi:hopanoid-associated sugar epimerase [Magnetospira sp. QH-2]|uniref:hopanoid-associated sugar epimerase n=1 Tax=Magnetospira sp. (strain QH-2) TaxID=1288970 RepID=UPI0003E80B56|nr:hopanoid-associated sugar epimerase [Magnetospira sp. QH-2]CCQ73414.1 Putative HpnA: hopanoid-associated sugar epimerase [Magnetospira sp. QH-2]